MRFVHSPAPPPNFLDHVPLVFVELEVDLLGVGSFVSFCSLRFFFCQMDAQYVKVCETKIWLLIKIPLSRNGHFSRIKNYFCETCANSMFIFRGAHVGQQHLL